MNNDILHPCGRLYRLERSLHDMAQTQLELAYLVNELAQHPGVSAACESLSTHAIVMAGAAKRLRELRHELSEVLP